MFESVSAINISLLRSDSQLSASSCLSLLELTLLTLLLALSLRAKRA
jgi:hypothetical protein